MSTEFIVLFSVSCIQSTNQSTNGGFGTRSGSALSKRRCKVRFIPNSGHCRGRSRRPRALADQVCSLGVILPSDVDLFGDLDRIIYLGPKVANRALKKGPPPRSGQGLQFVHICLLVSPKRRSGLRNSLSRRALFTTLREAEVLIENWRRHYNAVRPHSSLNYRPPAPEAILPPAPDLPYAPLRPTQTLADDGRVLT